MARAETRTFLSLDRWAQIIGIDPRHFNQVTTELKPATVCSNVWKQYPWQETGQVGREDVALAIQQAEETLGRYLGYKLLPTWEVDERQQTPKPGAVELFNRYAVDVRGFWLGTRLNWGHFVSGGVEAKSLVEAGAAVSWPVGAGYRNPATVIVAAVDANGNAITDPSEIAVYFPGENGADEWEIRPLISVSIAAGIATITIWRHQLVDPNLWEALDPEDVDGDDDGNFVATLDVYRHYNDPQQQVQLMWSQRPYACDCCSSACPACAVSTQWGCLSAKDYRLGLVSYRPAAWDSDDEEFDPAELTICRNPDRLRLWYYAGYQDQRRTYPTIQMDPVLERAVAYYSLPLLDRPLCGCNNVEEATQKWREELNLNIADRTYQLSPKLLDNPLGMTRGALFAWQVINERQRGLGRAAAY